MIGSGNLIIHGSSSNIYGFSLNSDISTNFSGTTTVESNGKLFLGSTGKLGGTIVVENTGLLIGYGTAEGAVTVKSGGTLGAGSLASYTESADDIDLNGGLTAESGSTLDFTLNGATARTGYDQLKVVGAVDITGAKLTLEGSYTPLAGNVFTLITNDASDAIIGTFNGLAEGDTVTVNGVGMTLSYIGGDGNDVTLTVQGGTNAIPENTISESYTTDEDMVKSITDLAVADAENNPLTVTLSVNHGAINIVTINTAANITVTDANGLDGSISFSGSVDDINAILADGVDYSPVANGNSTVTLTMTTSDGIADAVVNTAAINVTAINDAPTFNHSYGNFTDDFSGGHYYEIADGYAEASASALQPDGKLVSVGYAKMDI